MPGRSDFRLYHSNALDVLAGLLAQELRTPQPGQPLLAPDVVLIPQVAMRRWLQATLAQAHGIAANLEFLTPGEFVQRALDANVPGQGEDLDADGLRWRLYAALSDPALLREPALRPLRAYLRGGPDGEGGDDALKPWSLAGELASVFEKYQAWRRDWLLGWEAGHGRLDPQAALWRRIASGRRHRARRIDDYLARFGDGAALPAGLPPRLFAFATLNVSPDVLRVIASQALGGTLHFYLPTPTRKYWGDLATLVERLRTGAGSGEARDGDDAVLADNADGDSGENPLLAAWGAAGRDFMAVMGSYEAVHPSGEIAAYADPEDQPGDDPVQDSLLQRLQRDLLHRRPPPATPWRAAVDRADNSLQVHACHTRLREVQVLHDQLRGLLEDARFVPPLQPREIAVLAPDIDPYAPYIQAVFGGLAGRPEFIPYALADTSPLAAEPLAEVFLRLLALPISRFGLHEVLDLLATPAIAEPAGLDTAALARLRTWLHAAGARWGLDAAHRVRFDAPRDDAYTWAFALDRLLLGYASGDSEGEDVRFAGIAGSTPQRPATEGRAGPSEADAASPGTAAEQLHDGLIAGSTPQRPSTDGGAGSAEAEVAAAGTAADHWDGLIAGVAPYTDLEGSALSALDALIRLLRVLARYQLAFATAMTPRQWRERVLGLLDALLPTPPRSSADQRTLERLRTLLDGFAASAERAGFDAAVPPEVIRAYCQAALTEADMRAPLLTGGISFGRMVPMRLLPFRAICVLGMNDGDYPRRDPAAGLNQLTAELGTDKRRRGDRSLRDDDRFLFLQLFAAASAVFYLSYLGADPRDGSAREPSLLVAELLDAASNYHADRDGARAELVVHHPLQPFAPAAFGAGADHGNKRVGGNESTALEPRRFSYRSEWHPAADAAPTVRAGPQRWLVESLPPTTPVDSISLLELRQFLRDPAGAFLRQRLALRLPEAADAIDDCDPLAPPAPGLGRWQLQQAIFDACVRGKNADLPARLRALALLPSGPLGARQLTVLLDRIQPYADAFVHWRGVEQPQAQAFELDLDGVHLHGRIEQFYGHGLPRFRYDTLHGPAQISHGLDWLVLNALGHKLSLVQFHDTGRGPGPSLRPPAAADAARAALRALLRLRLLGLSAPLPFGPRAGWIWYNASGHAGNIADTSPVDTRDKGWEAARQQWHAERGFSEGNTDSARLALRGRDPFGDDELGEEFRAIARIVFDAVVHGRDAEAVA